MEPPDRHHKLAYAARISQRLSGPSEAITGFLDLIFVEVQNSGPTDALEDLEKVRTAAARLARMISNLTNDPRDIASDADLQVRLRHDLRSPINAIIGYSEMIAEDFADDLAPSTLQDLNVILQEARRLTLRIDEVVDGALSDDSEEDVVNDGLIAESLERSINAANPDKNALTGHILVIDDEAPNREILKRQLERRGHTVKAVGSAAETFSAMQEEQFDLVLLDILMPQVNGIQVLEHIKSDGALRETPVVMVSGLKETGAIARCISIGAEDYLPKPIDPVLLHARVDACLERKRWRAREIAFNEEIKYEKDRADTLLLSMLPAPVILRLNNGETHIADRFEGATIVFADIVDFTPLVARIDASALVRELSSVFTAFDELALHHDIEKIKTIGDAYMAASGIPAKRPDHAEIAVDFARSMIRRMGDSSVSQAGLQIRVGVHSGPVIAGLIGRTRSVYDVWGETVNLASRLESSGQAGKIHISDATRRSIGRHVAACQAHQHSVKGIGPITSYFID
ncbi:adenylate/guanylate cyclase domain-containing protein [Tateyamaria pelophila]|uniref:adenylate/guanylate cyclase domain-containing protein n=1 Tax=Tateyamaria pelophila TaxID=328415 RepID=UPI001CBB0374|nr:adenylate/guanylate cyclase domain-containing protein [Tateyamaria pelophila]